MSQEVTGQTDSAAVPEKVYVFAYGTLRPDLYEHVPARFNVKPVGGATLYGNYELLNLGAFPGLVKTAPKLGERPHPDGGAAIVGHVIEAKDLVQMDRYESYPSLYTREQVEVIMEDGSLMHPWVYLFNGSSRRGEVITSGNWADIHATRR